MNSKTRKILFGLLLIIATSLNIFPQWSTDPNNNLVIGTGWDPHIVSDSAGGCYISYNYDSFYPQKLAVERVDKYGYKPWGEKKQILGELPEQWQAEIIEDGEGGIIVSYQDNEVSGTVYVTRVRVQRIDRAGNFLWGQTGVRVTLSETNQGGQELVSDGEGGCIIVWQDYDGKYWINHIDNIGQRVWSDTGKVLGTSAYSERPRIIRAADGNYFAETGEYIYRIRHNGERMLWESTVEWGLIVATPDGGGVLHSSIWNPSFYKLLAQRKDTLGNNLWQEPYVEIADSLDINTHLEIKHNNGFIYYSWSGMKNGIDKVVQFQALRLDGTKLFSNGSIRIGIPPLGGAYIVTLEQNRTSFIYHETNYLPDSLLAQTYDTLGNKVWDTNGVLISHPSIEYSSFTTDGSGGFIIGGVIDNFTVVAQQVNKYGYLGEIITDIFAEENKIIPAEIKLFQNYPNPFNPTTTINYYLPSASNVSLIIYDILGSKVKELVNAKHEAGSYEVQLNASSLTNGVYIYQLIAGEYVDTKKMILLK